MTLGLVLVICLAIGNASGINYQGTRHRKLLFVDSFVSWNNAAKVCSEQHGKLVTMDSDDVFNAIKGFQKTAWDYGLIEFWLGLHNPDENSPYEYRWESDCSSLGAYQPWDYEEPGIERCALAEISNSANRLWQMEWCSRADNQILCEIYEDECDFETFTATGLNLDESDSYITTFSMNEEMCKIACLEYSEAVECWGASFTYAAGVRLCILHHAISYTAIKQRTMVPDGLTTYFRKNCIGVILNPSVEVDRSLYTNPMDDHPWKGCSMIDKTDAPPKKTTSTEYLSPEDKTTTAKLFAKSTATTPTAIVTSDRDTSTHTIIPKPVTTNTPTFKTSTTDLSPEDTITTAKLFLMSTATTPTSIVTSDRDTSTHTIIPKPVTTNTPTFETSTISTIDSELISNISGMDGIVSTETPSLQTSTLGEAHTIKANKETNTMCKLMSDCQNSLPNFSPTNSTYFNRSTTQRSDQMGITINYPTSTEVSSTEPSRGTPKEHYSTLGGTNLSGPFIMPIPTSERPATCWCFPKKAHPKINGDFMSTILRNLVLERTKVSANLHRFDCMVDSRTSAKVMGVTSLVLVMVAFITVVISDVIRLANHVNNSQGLQRGNHKNTSSC